MKLFVSVDWLADVSCVPSYDWHLNGNFSTHPCQQHSLYYMHLENAFEAGMLVSLTA